MSDEYPPWESKRMVDVSVGGDGAVIDRGAVANMAVIVGAQGAAIAGSGGLAYAGNGSKSLAKVERYGVAVCGDKGIAKGGAGCVLFAYDGGSAEGGDGSFAIARRGGDASCGAAGMASALDGNATASGRASIAMARRQNRKDVRASAASGGVAIARDYEVDTAKSGPALAHAETGAIAIAFEDNHLSGDLGALLVGTYRAQDGSTRFATAVVDGKVITPGRVYEVDSSGQFVRVRSAAGSSAQAPEGA